MASQRSLTIEYQDSEGLIHNAEFEVLSFEYNAQINQPFELMLKANVSDDSDAFDVNWLYNQAAQFTLSDQEIPEFTFSGVVKSIELASTMKQMKRQYHILVKSGISLLDRQYNASFQQSSLPAVIRSVVAYAGIPFAYNEDQFSLLHDQQSGRYHQILKGNGLDFFHYQINAHGIYYSSFDASGETVHLVPDLRFLPPIEKPYVLNYNEHRTSQGASTQARLRRLAQYQKENRVEGDGRYRHYQDNKNELMARPGQSPHAKAKLTRELNYRPDEKTIIDQRVHAIAHAFDGAQTLSLDNIILTPGQQVQINLLKGLTNQIKAYWIYGARLTGFFNEDKHWQLRGELTLLPYPESTEVRDFLWYPGLVKRPIGGLNKLGATYDASHLIADRGELPLILQKPFNADGHDQAFYGRALQPSASSLGGQHVHGQESGYAALSIADNDPNHFITTAWSGNSDGVDIIDSMKMAYSHSESAGGVEKGFKRRRPGSDYAHIKLNTSDDTGRLSGMTLGGMDEAKRQLFHQPDKTYEGTTQHSTSFGLRSVAGSHTETHGAENHQISYSQNFDDNGDIVAHQFAEDSHTSTYTTNYYPTPYVSSSQPTQIENARPYLTRLSMNTAFSGYDGEGNPLYQTQITWDAEPKGTAYKVAVSGKNLNTSRQLSAGQYSDAFTSEAGEAYMVELSLLDGQSLKTKNTVKLAFTQNPCFKTVSFYFTPSTQQPQYDAEMTWECVMDQAVESCQVSVDGASTEADSTVYLQALTPAAPCPVIITASGEKGVDEVLKLTLTPADYKPTVQQATADQDPAIQTQMDSQKIEHVHNLKETHVYADSSIDRTLNAVESHLSRQTYMNADTFDSRTHANALRQTEFPEYSQDKRDTTTLLQNAKGIAPKTESLYTRDHSGQSSQTHQGQTTIQRDLAKSINVTYSADDVAVTHTQSQLTLKGDSHITTVNGDRTYSAKQATRQADSMALTAQQGLSIVAQNLIAKSGSQTVTAQHYKTSYGSVSKTGIYNIKSQALHFDAAAPSNQTAQPHAGITSQSNSASSTKMAGQQTFDKLKLEPGLQTISVSPRWYKSALTSALLGQADNIESMAALPRLPMELQTFILETIAQYYTASSAEEDQAIEVPKTLTSWSALIQNGYQSRITGLKSSISAVEAKIQSTEASIAAQKANSGGAGAPVNIDLSSVYQVQLQADQKKLSAYQSHLRALQKQNPADIIEGITSQIYDCLIPAEAPHLRSGYLYVFMQCAEDQTYGAGAFSEPRLYKEYKLTQNIQGVNYSEVNLLESAGFDHRQASVSVSHPMIPSVYLSPTKQVTDAKVWVLFSGEQLSWPRLAKLGGVAPNDTRISNMSASPLKSMIMKLAGQNDQSLLAKHAQSISSDLLKSTWKGQLLQQPTPIPTPLIDQTSHSVWAQNTLCFTDLNNEIPNLLCQDPLGLIMEQNQITLWGQRQVSQILDEVNHNFEMKSAVLAYQAYFNPEAMGLKKVTGMIMNPNNRSLAQQWMATSNRYDGIMKGQADMDEQKVLFTLKNNSREFYKTVMRYQQQQVVNSLEQESLEPYWVDLFSQGTGSYLSAHSAFMGLIQPTCLNVNGFDASLCKSEVPTGSIDIKTETHLQPGGGIGSSYQTYQGYTETNYQRSGYAITKTVTEYDENDQLKRKTTTVDKTLTVPVGYAFLEQHVFDQSAPLYKMLFPSKQSEQNFTENLAQNQTYMMAEGQYNGVLLGQANQVRLDLINDTLDQTHDSADAKAEAMKDKLEAWTRDQMVEVIKEKGATGIDSFLNSMAMILVERYGPYTVNKSLFTHIKEKLFVVASDAYQMPRTTLTIGGENPTLASIILIPEKRAENIRFSQFVEQQSVNTEYKINSINYTSEEATTEFSNDLNNSMKTLDQVQQKNLNGFTTIDVENIDAAESKSVQLTNGFRALINSTFGVYLAWNEFNAATEKLEATKEKDQGKLDTIADITTLTVAFSKALANSIEVSNEYFKKAAKALGKYDQYTAWAANLGLKNPAISDLIYYTFDAKTAAGIDLATSISTRSLKSGQQSVIETLYRDIPVLSYMDVAANALMTLQAASQWFNSLNYNDRAMATSNFMSMLSQGFGTIAAATDIGKKVAEKTAANAFASLADRTLANATVETAEKFAERGALITLGELAGVELIPGVNIVATIAIGFQMIAMVAELFKDNEFQSWAKGSSFAKN